MKVCHSCGSENSADAKFCRKCGADIELVATDNIDTMEKIFVCQKCGYESSEWLGRCPTCSSWGSLKEKQRTPISLKCPKCNSIISVKAKFCKYCGTKLEKAVKEAEAERDIEKPGYSYETTENIDQLKCKHGCGGTLIETKEPDIFKCEYCGSTYLVKREAGSLRIIREIKKQIDHVKNMQELIAMKENARIDLDNLEDWYRDFKNNPFVNLFKSITICSAIFLGLGILLSNIEAISDFGIFLGVFGGLIMGISFLYWWSRYKKNNRYIAEKTRLTNIIKMKLKV